MRKAMITVCGIFGNKYWISDLMLTCFGKLCEMLGKCNVSVTYADSMDNAQMRDPVRSIEIEAGFAVVRKVDFLFVLFRDDLHDNNLYETLRHLRRILSPSTTLVLVELFTTDAALTRSEKETLEYHHSCLFLTETDIRNGVVPDYILFPSLK